MSYFFDHYARFTYPITTGAAAPDGFRLAQVGAIHAVAGHFTTRKRPAIVVMPTGTGKTGVLTALPFVLRATRVLVVVPSRLLRDQLSREFRSLSLLRAVGAIPAADKVPSPDVGVLKKRVGDAAGWDQLRAHDVVVSIPSSSSPGQFGVAEAPRDLFDLVLVDEAHHEAAATWRALTSAFDAKVVLCSATPFRRDAREIRGSVVFDYPLRNARDDGSFSDIQFIPVAGGDDRAIALRVQAEVLQDRAAGLQHHVLIRTDRKVRADELLTLYSVETALRLQIIHGGVSGQLVNKVLERIRKDELDGVIAVNMMGEGIDLPTLKVAGLHAPYRSIAATLQFLGRLTRTNANVGAAKLVAIPSDIQIEAERLYAEDAVWSELVPRLLANRIDAEVELKRQIDTFEADPDEDLDDGPVSLYALTPYFHVKVFKVSDMNLDAPMEPPRPEVLVTSGFSAELNTRVLVTVLQNRPRWVRDSDLSDRRHGLHVFVGLQDKGLLFICTSARTEKTYKHFVIQIGSSYEGVPFYQVKRALRDLNNPRFISVGMRNTITGTATESYRMLAGKSAEQGIRVGDERVYGLGHAFGVDATTTVGVSTLSKVWSHQAKRIPDLVEWCTSLGERLVNEAAYIVNARLDALGVAVKALASRDDVFAIEWHEDTWLEYLAVQAGGASLGQLSAMDPVVTDPTSDFVDFKLVSGSTKIAFRYRPTAKNQDFFEGLDGAAKASTVEVDGEVVTLVSYLSATPPRFHAASGGYLEGGLWLAPKAADSLEFPDDRLLVWDWSGVDIRSESKAATGGRINIQKRVRNEVTANSAAGFIFDDDGAQELADLVVIEESGTTITLTLYHCKYSSEDVPGARIKDLYEVCGQGVKSARRRSGPAVLAHLRHRFATHRQVRGDLLELDRLESLAIPWRFRVVLVQPGVSKAKLSKPMTEIVAATDVYLQGQGFEPLLMICSA